MARPSNRRLRRAQIVAAFQRVLASHGYAGATTARVAAEAGLTSGLLHYHFEGKQQILLALAETLATTAEQRLAVRDAAATSATDRLFAFVDGLLALGDDADPAAAAAWVLIGAEAVHQPEVAEVYRRWTSRLIAAALVRLTAAAAEHGRVLEAPAVASLALVSCLEGVVRMAAASEAVPVGGGAEVGRRVASALVGLP